jgi:hypothetical protein
MIKCIICKKWLKTEREDNDDRCTSIFPVYDGVLCRSYGNFGSTLYDPMHGGDFLQFAICDKCLDENGDDIQRIKYTEEKSTVIRKKQTFKEYLENGDE